VGESDPIDRSEPDPADVAGGVGQEVRARPTSVVAPTPPALAHYITEAAAEQTGIGRRRYAPATLTWWVASINQVHTARRPGRARLLRG